MEGIDKLFVTGNSAWFTVKEGATVDEASVQQAIDSAAGLGFTSHEVVEKPKPVAAWVIPSGFT